MTAVSVGKPTRRETAVCVRGRALIVELHPGFLTVREKGRRQAASVDYRAVYDLAYKLLARQAAAEKAASKRGKR